MIAPLSTAQSGTDAAELVEAGDDDLRTLLDHGWVTVGFADIDRNGGVTVAEPAEPVYLDLDRSGTVSFEDRRLTTYLNYPADTAVNHTNRDFGLHLQEISGWFAHDGDGTWYLDTDDDKTVSPGDLRIIGAGAERKVRDGQSDVGTELIGVQERIQADERIGWVDREEDFRLDHDDTFYLDLKPHGQVSEGDLRFPATQITPEDPVFQEDLDQAVAALEAENERLEAENERLRVELQAGDDEMGSRLDRQATAMSTLEEDLRSWNQWLLVLGLVDLAGVVGLGYLALRRNDAL